jgi:hypothetical protein
VRVGHWLADHDEAAPQAAVHLADLFEEALCCSASWIMPEALALLTAVGPPDWATTALPHRLCMRNIKPRGPGNAQPNSPEKR